MPRLHLGVRKVHYTYGNQTRTTDQVAGILEGRYQIMETFTKDNNNEIGKILRDQAERYTRMAIKGRKPNLDPAYDKIKRMFKSYILRRQLDGRGLSAGFPIPTKASLRGVNHRLKHPYAKRAPRPSFFDTGLYVDAFRAWVE